jgi:hypothetical protein
MITNALCLTIVDQDITMTELTTVWRVQSTANHAISKLDIATSVTTHQWK